MSRSVVSPDLNPDALSFGGGRWMVVIFNNDHTLFHDVVQVLMRATDCTYEEAYTEAWEAHHYGQASVHFAHQNECERVARQIAAIGVKTEVRPEWDE